MSPFNLPGTGAVDAYSGGRMSAAGVRIRGADPEHITRTSIKLEEIYHRIVAANSKIDILRMHIKQDGLSEGASSDKTHGDFSQTVQHTEDVAKNIPQVCQQLNQTAQQLLAACTSYETQAAMAEPTVQALMGKPHSDAQAHAVAQGAAGMQNMSVGQLGQIMSAAGPVLGLFNKGAGETASALGAGLTAFGGGSAAPATALPSTASAPSAYPTGYPSSSGYPSSTGYPSTMPAGYPGTGWNPTDPTTGLPQTTAAPTGHETTYTFEDGKTHDKVTVTNPNEGHTKVKVGSDVHDINVGKDGNVTVTELPHSKGHHSSGHSSHGSKKLA
jgi:hypothetical protein